jgi:ABC-type antimicrobial peptide transport system permease subunit
MIARLALRGLAAHRLRLGLSALAVVLGVAFASCAMIFSATMNRAFDAMYATAGRGTDAVVRARQAFGDEDTAVPASLLGTVRGVPGVAMAHGEVRGFAAIVDRGGKVVIGPQDTPQIGVDWSDDPDSAMETTSGHGPRTPEEIAIDADTAKKTGYRVGDRVRVVLRGPSRTFTLAGVFEFGGSAGLGGTSMTAFAPATAEQVVAERPGTYSEIAVRAAPGVSQEQVRDALAAALPAGFEAVTGRRAAAEAAAEIKDKVGILPKMLLNFSIVALFVGSFIIVNTFSMLAAQRTRELALLRAVGATRAQVTRSMLGEAAGIGLAGATLGLGAGIALATGLRALFGALGDELPAGDLVISAPAVVWAYVVGAIVTPAAAYLPARRAARIPPVAALREDAVPPARSLRRRRLTGAGVLLAGTAALAGGIAGPSTYAAAAGAVLVFLGVTLLGPVVCGPVIGVLGRPATRFLGITGRLGGENARRNPRRTASTASALTIGLALSGAVTIVASSAGVSIARQGLGADFYVSSDAAFGPQVRDAAAHTPGVRGAVAVRDARVALGGTVRAALAGDARAMAGPYRLTMEHGVAALGPGEVLVDHHTAASEGWTAGARVPGQFADGAQENLRVAGIYTGGGAMPPVILNPADDRAHSASRLVNEVRITLAPGADAVAARQALRSMLGAWPGLVLRDRAEMAAKARSGVDQYFALIRVLLVLSIIVAALGIVNTLALSVIERTREIGLLRAVGMDRRGLRRMIRYEAVTISVFGALTGLGLGVVLGWTVQHMAASSGVEVLSIPFAQLGLYVLAAGAIGVVAAAWPARRAARLDVLRAIAAM